MSLTRAQKIVKLRATVLALALANGNRLHRYKMRKNWKPFEEAGSYCAVCGEDFAIMADVCRPALKKLLKETKP